MVKIFPASLSRLYDMLQFIREQALSIGFDGSKVSQIELALEEALVNIISYGYPSRSGVIEINCSEENKCGFKVTLKDTGIPYNPLTSFKPLSPSSSLEARSIGGLGVQIIREMMDVVDYHHEENCNILTLIKYRK